MILIVIAVVPIYCKEFNIEFKKTLNHVKTSDVTQLLYNNALISMHKIIKILQHMIV